MRLEDLGLIGNCQYAALVERTGEVVWCCLPRFDAEPIFGSLLDHADGGRFLCGPASGELGVQSYVPNTNVLETRFSSPEGSFRVLDFAPRFLEHERFFRPTQLIRILEPVAEAPRVRVLCEPRCGWSKRLPERTNGTDQVRFEGFAAPLTLTTDIPLAYLEGRPFTLSERKHLVLSWGNPVGEPLPALCERSLSQTIRYWQRWVKHCNVPAYYQAEVIRSALALKLHCFEDTGAIVAAVTTSIPEAPGSGRTWDYRYCWLRDAFYVIAAFRMLGHFEERERFVAFLLDVCENQPELELSPLYRIDGGVELSETILQGWPGMDGEGPVRIGNAAALQKQNDVFGEMVLALAPIFLDDRFAGEQSREALALLERLTRKAIAVAGTPDAGIWEHRTDALPRTFSSLMCWAAADRMTRVAERHRPIDASEFGQAALRIRAQILEQAWSPIRHAFASSYAGQDLDASLLQMVSLRLLPLDDDRLRQTVHAIWRELAQDGWLLRYRSDDGFGMPTVAFVICTFWLVEALALLGEHADARVVFERARSALSPLGLLSEDYAATEGRMWGNFPQAYSHVGLIHAAFEASPRWSDIV